MKRTRLFGLFLITGLFTGGLFAQVTWDFSSATTPSTILPTGLLSASIAQFNTTTNGVNDTSASSGYTGASGANNLAFSAKSGAINTGTSTYFEVTLTPSSGYELEVTGIAFGSRSTASGPVALTLYSSANLTASLGSLVVSNDSAWALQSFGSLSLGAAPDSPLVFRVYGSGGSSTASNWRIDDLTVTVEAVAVPEPGTSTLLGGVAALALAGFRRTRGRPATRITPLAG